MQPYRVSVTEILGDHGASVHLEGDIDLGEFVVGDETFRGLGPAHFAVHLTNTGSGVVAVGEIAGEINARCARCLCDFPLFVEGEVEGFYVEDRSRSEVPEESDAESIHLDGTIDLAPALLGAVAIEVPFAPIHDAQCAGLCPVCGANLNEGPCGCHAPQEGEHPFAALKALLPEETPSQPESSSEE